MTLTKRLDRAIDRIYAECDLAFANEVAAVLTDVCAALSRAEPADAATSLIIEHIEKYDTPNDHDTRRRYTLAQVETAIRLAAKAEPAAVAGLAARLMKEADNMQYNDDLDSMDDGIKLMREAAAALSPAPAGVQAVPELLKLVRWAHDTLLEINPSNYDHDDVCRLNDASVEVILGLAPVLGETHGKSAEWWSARAAAPAAPVGEER